MTIQEYWRDSSACSGRTRTCPSCFHLLRLLKTTPISKRRCVILDINLNDGSGIELRQGLKADGVSVPVIYMTGNDDPAVRKAALDSGCIAFLTKPFSVQELMEPLKRAGRHPNRALHCW
ncbi:Response regulator receiver domain-containing protein [Bradyrhizobium erythrophlei]|nr:Response regulator receiver domain-containing protein [Bradyrhizobium erythrophlei]